jgi:osmoprotectant transport system permease protein
MGMKTPLSACRAGRTAIAACPVIVNGVRNAVVLNIAIAAIATYIGAGRAGTFHLARISPTGLSASSSPGPLAVSFSR